MPWMGRDELGWIELSVVPVIIIEASVAPALEGLRLSMMTMMPETQRQNVTLLFWRQVIRSTALHSAFVSVASLPSLITIRGLRCQISHRKGNVERL
jgi:hypothetical protein